MIKIKVGFIKTNTKKLFAGVDAPRPPAVDVVHRLKTQQ